MSLTAINSKEWARRKFFMNSTYSHKLARTAEKKFFHELDVHNV